MGIIAETEVQLAEARFHTEFGKSLVGLARRWVAGVIKSIGEFL